MISLFKCMHHTSPGRVKHTRLATSRVMHMKAISNTIWGKENMFLSLS